MFKLSHASLRKLEGVHPDLVKVMERAIANTLIDFTVIEGLRTKERQMELVASGASKTMDSRHITGHAVDIAPYINGTRFDWPLFYKLIPFVKKAAIECDVALIWGGVWDTPLCDLSDDMEHEVAKYVLRRKALGKSAFTDGPHLELNRRIYG